jgi:hypothetical protein
MMKSKICLLHLRKMTMGLDLGGSTSNPLGDKSHLSSKLKEVVCSEAMMKTQTNLCPLFNRILDLYRPISIPSLVKIVFLELELLLAQVQLKHQMQAVVSLMMKMTTHMPSQSPHHSQITRPLLAEQLQEVFSTILKTVPISKALNQQLVQLVDSVLHNLILQLQKQNLISCSKMTMTTRSSQ